MSERRRGQKTNTLVELRFVVIDDSTRYIYVYLLKTKYEDIDLFNIYNAEVENQLERKIKMIRFDHGG
jgi:hypothetical protein